MDLSKNPHDQISRPKFGDLDHKNSIEEQWKKYKKEIALVHAVFGMLSTKHLNLSLDSSAQSRMVHELKMGKEDYLRDWATRNLGGITDKYSKAVVAEAVRRFLAVTSGSDGLDGKGRTAWEAQ
jgi:hypothetical protein